MNFLKQRELEREEILKGCGIDFEDEIGNELICGEETDFYNEEEDRTIWRIPLCEKCGTTLKQHDKDTEQFKEWKEKLKDYIKSGEDDDIPEQTISIRPLLKMIDNLPLYSPADTSICECGHPKEYHEGHNLSCNALKCPCEKFTPIKQEGEGKSNG